MMPKFKQVLWDHDSDKFLQWHYWGFIEGEFIAPFGLGPLDGETHCQWTGLKDKAGRDIYRGDVVVEKNESGEFLYQVIWEEYECSFLFKPLFKAEININIGAIYTEVEITGNIYSNPKLLK